MWSLLQRLSTPSAHTCPTASGPGWGLSYWVFPFILLAQEDSVQGREKNRTWGGTGQKGGTGRATVTMRQRGGTQSPLGLDLQAQPAQQRVDGEADGQVGVCDQGRSTDHLA
jgi:hypothetical protein